MGKIAMPVNAQLPLLCGMDLGGTHLQPLCLVQVRGDGQCPHVGIEFDVEDSSTSPGIFMF
jgi:hexokinase